MKKSIEQIAVLFVLLLVSALFLQTHLPYTKSTPSAKLVVVIVVDQLRSDYLKRFEKQFTGGFKYLLENGAVFLNAHHNHSLTVTASGHATILSGKHPKNHGIIANRWVNRSTGRVIKSVDDPNYRVFGYKNKGVSPKHLRGRTLFDWINDKNSKKYAIAGKTRSAVFLAGKNAKNVYWYTKRTGGFTTSTYYQDSIPTWIKGFNRKNSADFYKGKKWSLLYNENFYRFSREDDFVAEDSPLVFGRTFPHKVPTDPARLRKYFRLTPWMDEKTLLFAKKIIKKEDMGRDEKVDVLAIGLSALDYIGHSFGPYSREIHDHMLRLDLMLKDFFKFLDYSIGLKNVVIVLTSDHGAVALPEYNQTLGIEAKRFYFLNEVWLFDKYLQEVFKEGSLILTYEGSMIYFNRKKIRSKGISFSQLYEITKKYFERNDKIERIFTRDELLIRKTKMDAIEEKVRNNFYSERSGDVVFVFKKDYLDTKYREGTSHGSPYAYDTQVPVIFAGPMIKQESFQKEIQTIDIAPTLSTILNLRPKDRLDGKPLTEIISY